MSAQRHQGKAHRQGSYDLWRIVQDGLVQLLLVTLVPEGGYLTHAFGYACEQHGLEPRLTKPGHP